MRLFKFPEQLEAREDKYIFFINILSSSLHIAFLNEEPPRSYSLNFYPHKQEKFFPPKELVKILKKLREVKANEN
mgnify:CR=1 FL=1